MLVPANDWTAHSGHCKPSFGVYDMLRRGNRLTVNRGARHCGDFAKGGFHASGPSITLATIMAAIKLGTLANATSDLALVFVRASGVTVDVGRHETVQQANGSAARAGVAVMVAWRCDRNSMTS